MKPIISIGHQDFEKIRSKGNFYVDKTSFIKEWWENEDEVTLITRPRRFGKTLNMRMMETFFSIEHAGKGQLFEGLSIWNERTYRDLQGTYPVIFLSFANVKGKNFKDTRMGIVHNLVSLYSACDFIKDSERLNEKDLAYFDSVSLDMTDDVAVMAIHHLSNYLCRYYGKKVIVLLDEYDAPLQEAYAGGYWDEMAAFVCGLFNAAFKTNPCMERGVLTGVTRVSKESIFSDLNNLKVITTTSEQYATCFGFTEEEVFRSLKQQGLSDKKESVKRWYDGFTFGSHRDIYNPWSITNFLNDNKLKNYWANTSSNRLISKLIQEATPNVKMAMEGLLGGTPLKTRIDEEIAFDQLGKNDEAIWSLLLASGYLKVETAPDDFTDPERAIYQLALTNREVKQMFRQMFQGWFQNTVSSRYNNFITALLTNDLDYMNEYMNQIALETFSSFDTGTHPSKKSEPERFYHGFVLGLIVDLTDRYRITSNRESGLGRYDVTLEPLREDLDAMILEFKVFQPAKEADLEATVKNALAQIKTKGYDTELLARGIPQERIRHYGFAFEGSHVLIGQ